MRHTEGELPIFFWIYNCVIESRIKTINMICFRMIQSFLKKLCLPHYLHFTVVISLNVPNHDEEG